MNSAARPTRLPPAPPAAANSPANAAAPAAANPRAPAPAPASARRAAAAENSPASAPDAATPKVELTLGPRLTAQAQEQLRRAWQGFQQNPRGWLDHEAHYALHAYETLVRGLTPPPEPPAPAAKPAAIADYADQQHPAATAAVKAFAREVSPDPAWLQSLEQLLPSWPPEGPPAGAARPEPPPFAWHALQALPRPPAPPPRLQPPAPYMPRRHYRSRWQQA